MKKISMLIFTIIVILFISLNCIATSALLSPTPTPTSASTQTPTVTPSPTPTLTPTSTPDFAAAELQLSDLPKGFRPLNLSFNSDPNMKGFAYGDASPLQIIAGEVGPLQQNDQFGFDAMMKNPDLLLQVINAGSGDMQIKSLKPISSLDNFGDASNGFTGVTNSQGITLQTDIFIMHKGSIGVLLLSMYPFGQKPVVRIVDLAIILDKRQSRFPVNTTSG